jgi:hypothetical protein
MSKLIIDAHTGTIIEAEQCFIVDTDSLSDEDNDILYEASDDTAIADVATRNGMRVLA